MSAQHPLNLKHSAPTENRMSQNPTPASNDDGFSDAEMNEQ